MQGTPLDTEDPTLTAALSAVDKWGYDSCAFPRVDLHVTASGLSGIPATTPAGPVSFSLVNDAPADKAAAVLLVLKPTKHFSLEDVRSNKVDLAASGDILVAAQPSASSRSAYGTANLAAGSYTIAIPTGVPPHFGTTLAEDLHVS